LIASGCGQVRKEYIRSFENSVDPPSAKMEHCAKTAPLYLTTATNTRVLPIVHGRHLWEMAEIIWAKSSGVDENASRRKARKHEPYRLKTKKRLGWAIH